MHFDVVYAINPWMDPNRGVDRDLAMSQWRKLVRIYERLGHEVVIVEPAANLPDMVFSANAAFVIDDLAVVSCFATAERAPEAILYRDALLDSGVKRVYQAEHPVEGDGDLLLAGDVILAGMGFRTDPRAHNEIRRVTGREVVSLRLVDPLYYHLDLAACVLDETTIAYLPRAFDPASRKKLERRFPDAIVVDPLDARMLGLNAVSDGRHVVLAAQAKGFAEQVTERGFEPIPIDLSEFRKAGGGPKCCTMELRGSGATGNAYPPKRQVRTSSVNTVKTHVSRTQQSG